MITETDEHIIQDADVQYLATNIKSTLLRPFKPTSHLKYSVDGLIGKYIIGKNSIDLDYVEAGRCYIEYSDVVDFEINREYKHLKRILHKHYKVRKYTKSVNTPFVHGKIYHFKIENYSTYMDFYLMCFGFQGHNTHRYDQYILSVSEDVLEK